MGLQSCTCRRFILLRKLDCVFMEQLLLFVLVYTGITNPEGPVSIIYGQSDAAGVLIEKLYSLLYCTPGLVSLGNLSAQTNTLRTEGQLI